MTEFALIIPTRNGAACLDRLLPALAMQKRQPRELLVVDSSSRDDTAERLRQFGADVRVIPVSEFNHGGTRRWASEQVTADILVYLTQDAIPATADTFGNLIKELESEADIGIAYGRQLPHADAGLLGAHARQFNYPPESQTKRLAQAATLGIKTCFSSDSFCAYKREVLDRCGGFPPRIIGSEDAYMAGKALLAGFAVRYAASAQVYHSHDYKILEELRRYFDIGVFYGREKWIGEAFGTAGGEGKRYVKSEIQAILRAGKPWRLPEVLMRNTCKLLGYKLGYVEAKLPLALKRHISMFPPYWV